MSSKSSAAQPANVNAIALVRRLLSENAVSEWKSFLLSFLLLAVVSGCTGATAYLMKDVVNSIFIEQDQGKIFFVALVISSVFTAKGVCTYLNAMTVARLGMRIVAKLQKRFYMSLLSQGLDYYQSVRGGIIMNRFTHNSNAARSVIETVAMNFWRDALSLVALTAVMFIQSPLMSLSVLVIGPPAVYGTMYLMRQVKVLAKQEAESVGHASAILKETVDNVRVIKAYTLEPSKVVEMQAAIAFVQMRAIRLARLAMLTVPMMEILAGISIGAAIMFTGYQIATNAGDAGAFFSFLAAFLMAYDPARRLARFNVEFQRNLIGLELFYEMIDQVGSDSDRENAVPLKIGRGEIRFDDVSFSYKKTPALHDVSFHVAPGKMMALVGPSGAGKSTIFSLLERFYSPTSGTITIDGHDLEDVTATSLRDNIAIVTQDPQLFEGTIADNIRLGRADATHAEIVEAAKAANAHDFIESIGGYDRQVGTAGTTLSGGQRQRIAIARAILRDAPILLLDEATSALDTLSEIAVQEALTRLTKGRTTLAIAHRLSTIFHADTILVFEEGRLIESGAHNELVDQDGLYARLYVEQVERMQRRD